MPNNFLTRDFVRKLDAPRIRMASLATKLLADTGQEAGSGQGLEGLPGFHRGGGTSLCGTT